MRQIIGLEKQFMTIPFPASGSLYYRRDLEESQPTIPLSDQSSLPPFDQVVVGPTAQYEWWYRERALLDVDRGPCMSLSLSLSLLRFKSCAYTNMDKGIHFYHVSKPLQYAR